MSKIYIFFVLFVLGAFVPILPVHAEGSALGIGSLMPGAGVVKNADQTYKTLSYPDLFRLAWGMGAYQTSDIEAIDSYLRIAECDLYNKNYQNEFKWDNIRRATQKYLDAYGDNVSKYYEYVQPLVLSRYDNSLQGFPLDEAEQYVALKILQIADYKLGTTSCGEMKVDGTKYPSAAVVSIISPLSLTFIRASRELAEQYLEWRTANGLENGDKRITYIRYRVRLDGFSGIRSFSNISAYVFEGRLMQIDVYADPELMMPLYNQIF